MVQLIQSFCPASNEKAKASGEIITDALSRARKPAVGFSGGKKSTALLHMVRQACTVPIKVFYVRTEDEFEEMGRFAEKIKRLWRIGLIVVPAARSEAAADPPLCCRPAISATLGLMARTHAIDCLFLGNASDDALHINPQCETGIVCVNPILAFSRGDINDYMQRHKIPCCSLYGANYQKLDCRKCTRPAAAIEPRAAGEEEKLIQEKLKLLGYL